MYPARERKKLIGQDISSTFGSMRQGLSDSEVLERESTSMVPIANVTWMVFTPQQREEKRSRKVGSLTASSRCNVCNPLASGKAKRMLFAKAQFGLRRISRLGRYKIWYNAATKLEETSFTMLGSRTNPSTAKVLAWM